MHISIEEACRELEENSKSSAVQDVLDKALSGATSIQQASGITDSQLEVFYSMAYSQYDVNQYVSASRIFAMLCAINPYTHKYWMGLGASLQMDKSYEKAAEAYSMAIATLESDNPEPCISAGECFAAIGDIDDALAAFQLAKRYAKSHEQWLPLDKKISNIVTALEAQKKESEKPKG